MANVFLAAALLSGILAVSGCAGPLPGIGGYGYGGGGGYPSYGGGQSYPYDPGVGGGYAQPVQPYYQPQPYAYSGAPEVYVYQPAQPVPQATREHSSALPGRWIDRRQQRQEDRIRQGQASGQLTPREARRLQNEQAHIRGAEGRMRADGNLSPQERARLNAMQQRSSQDIYRQRHNGVQPGPTAQPRPTGPARPTAQLRPAGQPQAAMQPQAAVQPRATAQPRAAAQPRTAAQPRSNGGRPARNGEGAP
jgi:hypothetical protein